MTRINLDRQQKIYQLGIRLRKLRESLYVDGYPMTQKYLADDTGLSQGVIYQIEAGIKPPTVDAVVCITQAFKRVDKSITADLVLGLVDEEGNKRASELGGYGYRLLTRRENR
jgi:transcriptional regulator with XRE-family HTH domain